MGECLEQLVPRLTWDCRGSHAVWWRPAGAAGRRTATLQSSTDHLAQAPNGYGTSVRIWPDAEPNSLPLSGDVAASGRGAPGRAQLDAAELAAGYPGVPSRGSAIVDGRTHAGQRPGEGYYCPFGLMSVPFLRLPDGIRRVDDRFTEYALGALGERLR